MPKVTPQKSPESDAIGVSNTRSDLINTLGSRLQQRSCAFHAQLLENQVTVEIDVEKACHGCTALTPKDVSLVTLNRIYGTAGSESAATLSASTRASTQSSRMNK
jgi:hypothetical protein